MPPERSSYVFSYSNRTTSANQRISDKKSSTSLHKCPLGVETPHSSMARSNMLQSSLRLLLLIMM